MIRFAIAKGRLGEESAALLARCGVDTAALKEDTRKLVLESADKKYGFYSVKPADVPVYVESGVADLGIVGKDTLLEESRDICELLDLKLGACSLCVAGFENDGAKTAKSCLRVATKYVRTARRYFAEKGDDAEIIPLHGSIELAPVTGLADVIFDVVQTGSTLRANGLAVLEKAYDVTARLVANKVSLKWKSSEILPLVEKLKEVLP